VCGIAGIYCIKGNISGREFYDAHKLLAHRGPDDEGFVGRTMGSTSVINRFKGDDTIEEFSNEVHISSVNALSIIMGHRRLSIIDLSSKGHQPQSFNHLSMVFNGEIFNYRELSKSLKANGYTFESSSDTEVVLKAFHFWGEECFKKFNGMWALSIYDAKKNTLLLSRDRFGQKPLFYSFYNNKLTYASENKFIRKLGVIENSVDTVSLNTYIETSVQDHNDRTAYTNIKNLPPGHILHVDKTGIKISKYWNFQPTFSKKLNIDAKTSFKSKFEKSLELRMQSDVPVGSLLSGGLDSTVIVGSLNHLELLNDSFEVFSAVFKDDRFSEKIYIEETIKRLDIKGHYIYPKPEDVIEYLPKLLHHMEMPFRSIAVLSQHLIYKYISEHSNIKVALNGQGADEAFGGYTMDLFNLIVANIGRGSLGNALKHARLLKDSRAISNFQLIGSVVKRLAPDMFTRSYYNKKSFNHISSSALKEYLKYDDRNSMAYGIEARAPFMDYELMEFAFSLSHEEKNNKSIIREYGKDKTPEMVLNRKDKMGFISPQEVWQAAQLKPYIIEVYETLSKGDNILDMDKENKILKNYFSTTQNWQRVWRVFCYGFWLNYNYE